jgi:TonB family protein
MKEESWSKMFVVALILHVILLAGFSVPLRKAARRLDIPSYSVNLVTDVGDGPVGAGPKSKGGASAAIVKKAAPPPPSKKTEPAKPVKEKAVPTKVAEKERSISTVHEKTATPKKPEATPPRNESTSREEVNSLDETIKQLKKRAQHAEVSVSTKDTASATKGQASGGTGFGSGGPGTGGGTAKEKYISDVRAEIEKVWSVPNILSMRKDLVTAVTLKIRKDGRIMDWTIDERSTNRVYDESIVRALRGIDKLPPIPDALGEDTLELPLNFYPPAARR